MDGFRLLFKLIQNQVYLYASSGQGDKRLSIDYLTRTNRLHKFDQSFVQHFVGKVDLEIA